MDAKQNISSIRHFLKKRHWVSDVFAGMCLVATHEAKMMILISAMAICTYALDYVLRATCAMRNAQSEAGVEDEDNSQCEQPVIDIT